MKYDKKALLKALQDEINPHLYAAMGEGGEVYEDAIGEVDAWLEGHTMTLQEMREAE